MYICIASKKTSLETTFLTLSLYLFVCINWIRENVVSNDGFSFLSFYLSLFTLYKLSILGLLLRVRLLQCHCSKGLNYSKQNDKVLKKIPWKGLQKWNFVTSGCRGQLRVWAIDQLDEAPTNWDESDDAYATLQLRLRHELAWIFVVFGVEQRRTVSRRKSWTKLRCGDWATVLGAELACSALDVRFC